MPPPLPVLSLLELCIIQIPKIIKTGVLGAGTRLVNEWYAAKQAKNKQGVSVVSAEPTQQVLLTSGRVKEGEEAAFSGQKANTVIQYEHREQKDQYEMLHADVDVNLSSSAASAVTELQNWVQDSGVPGLIDRIVAAVIKGIEEAVVDKHSEMHQQVTQAQMAKTNTQMYIILSFVDCIVSPTITKIDISKNLQAVRSRLFSNLPGLTGLRTLILGEGSHGYLPELYKIHFMDGPGKMGRLVHFSLHYDCFDALIHQLSTNCAKTLRILDIEGSLHTTDLSVTALSRLKRVVDLNLFATGLTNEGQASVLISLPDLVELRRGDYLTDALDWIAYWPESENQILKIVEFFCSESYHFHTQPQMEMVAKHCPHISKMRFMFSKEHFVEFTPLKQFKNLRELTVCGGDMYSDNLIDLLEAMGHQLTRLQLFYVDEIDTKAVALISVYCPNLFRLSFSNCGFKPTVHQLTEESDSFERSLMSRDQPVTELMQPMLNLQELVVSSACSIYYVSLLILKSTNLRLLDLGVSIEVTDKFIQQMVSYLPWLEHFSVRGSERTDLTIEGGELLLNSCVRLNQLLDLRGWCGVYPREIEHLITEARENNWDLFLGDDTEKDTEEALRRAGLKEKFDRLRDQFGDMVMIP